MVKDFIEEFAKLFAFHPEEIQVEESLLDNNHYQITIYAKNIDVGRLIGKEGQMIKSIKNVISGCKAKENKEYKLLLKEIQ